VIYKMAVSETEPLVQPDRKQSTHSVNGERILGQLRALKASYGAVPNQSIAGVTIRVFAENSVDTTLGRREQIYVEPDEKIGRIVDKYLDLLSVESNCPLVIKDKSGCILDQEMTVADAGIVEDDVLYLEQGERAIWAPWTGCWKPTSLVLIFGLCILGCALALYMKEPEQPFVYTVLLDAGSVHTSVFVYRYSRKVHDTAVIEQVLNCEIGNQVGISSFANHPELLIKYFNSTCFRSAVDMVYEEHDIAAPVVLAGTAGMRVLSITSPLETQWIMGNLTMALTKLANNQREVYVKIISGMSEGLAGWVTANYLGETLIKDPKEFNDMAVKGLTYGALDWGGASAQITMEVPISDANYDVTLYGANHHLFTVSHLCYGQKMAIYRHRAQLVYEAYLETGLLKRRIEEPCGPKESIKEHTFKDLFGTACTKFTDAEFMGKVNKSKGRIQFIGTGNVTQCHACASIPFNYTLCTQRFIQYTEDTVCLNPSEIRPPPKRPFYAFSTYWYLIDALDLPTTHSMQEYKEKVYELCITPRTRLLKAGIEEKVVDSACFKALFMLQLLIEGYHFNQHSYEQIQFVRDLNGAEVGWTLGHTIISSNSMPAVTPTEYISDMMFGVCMIGVFCCVLFSICVICTYQGMKSHKYNKQKSPFKPRMARVDYLNA